jgi:ubiquinone/menaquinone biosynthesis C-methylase UbiE
MPALLNIEDDYLATGFRDVDTSALEKISRCLDFMNALPCFIDYKTQSLEALSLEKNSTALDVACGLGDDVVRMKEKCGRAVGLDLSEKLISEAKDRHANLICEFKVGNAETLPFGNNEFDAVRVDRSLQHMENPAKVIHEMARVTRKGGTVFCAEPDWGTFIIGTPPSMITRRIQDAWVDSFRNPWIGRNLPTLMADAGIDSLQIEGHWLHTEGFDASNLVYDIFATVKKLASKEADEWLESYRKSQATAGVMLILCWGKKK